MVCTSHNSGHGVKNSGGQIYPVIVGFADSLQYLPEIGDNNDAKCAEEHMLRNVLVSEAGFSKELVARYEFDVLPQDLKWSDLLEDDSDLESD